MVLRPSGEFVYHLTYDNQNETQTSVYDSEAAMLESAREIIENGLELAGLDEKAVDDYRLLMDINMYEAMDKWSDVTGDNEFLNTEHKEIWTCKTNIDKLKEAIDDADAEAG